MASALFLGSWAVLMGPMIYGKSASTHPTAHFLRHLLAELAGQTLRRSCGWLRPSITHINLTLRPRVDQSQGADCRCVLSQTSLVSRAPAFHCDILRKHRVDSLVRGRGTYAFFLFSFACRLIPVSRHPHIYRWLAVASRSSESLACSSEQPCHPSAIMHYIDPYYLLFDILDTDEKLRIHPTVHVHRCLLPSASTHTYTPQLLTRLTK